MKITDVVYMANNISSYSLSEIQGTLLDIAEWVSKIIGVDDTDSLFDYSKHECFWCKR